MPEMFQVTDHVYDQHPQVPGAKVLVAAPGQTIPMERAVALGLATGPKKAAAKKAGPTKAAADSPGDGDKTSTGKDDKTSTGDKDDVVTAERRTGRTGS